jgi:O-antigen ligase
VWADYSILIFGFVTIINILHFNDNPAPQLIAAYDELLIPIGMYFLVRIQSPGENEFKSFFFAILFAVLAQTVIGIVSQTIPQVLPGTWNNLAGARTVGSLQIPAVYTSFLMLGALMFFHLALQDHSSRKRILYLAFFGLIFYGIFISFSRGSWLGAVIVLICLLYYFPRLTARILLVVGVLVVILGSTFLVDQLFQSYERMTSAEAQNSAVSRVTAVDASINMIKTKPLTGWGFGNFDAVKEKFVRRIIGIPIHDATSHNTYLTLGSELGLVALLLYIFPFTWWMYQSWQTKRYFPESGFWSQSLILILWLTILNIFVVTNFMDMVRFYPFGTTFLWLILGMISSAVEIQKKLSNNEERLVTLN